MVIKGKETLFRRLYRKAKNASDSSSASKNNSLRVKYSIFGVTLLICTFFFTFNLNEGSQDINYSDVHPGDKWSKQTIVAPFSFPIYKDKEDYYEELEKAKKETYMVFTQNENSFQKVLEKIDTVIINTGKEYKVAEKYYQGILSLDLIADLSSLDPVTVQKMINITFLRIKQFYGKISNNFIIDTSVIQIPHDVISVYIPPNIEKLIRKESLLDDKKFKELVKKELLNNQSALQQKIIEDFVSRNFIPNIEFSIKLTEEALEDAIKNVAKTEGFVRQGDEIVAKGELISKETAKKISSFEKFYYKSTSTKITIWVLIGNFGHASIIFSILIVYLIIIRKRIYTDNIQVAVLCGVILIVAAVSWVTMQIRTTLPIEYFIFLPGLSMLVAIAFDSRTAFYVTVTMALILSGVRGNDYDTATAMMFSGILAAYSVRDIQSRTQLFRSMLFIMIGFGVTICAFSLERSYEFIPTLSKLFISFLNATISPLITFGTLFVLERFTNLTTDLKLEEYSKLNHPILIKLNELAPGSYQHSVSMGLMAEKCAEAINANSLLAKVGAYFHDIGKLQRPEYFVENQMDYDNKHDMLAPRKSAESIKIHVADGIKLAKEYNLPNRIIDFIPMHHGTSVIKHFYAKAIDEAHGATIDENDFRYPGPKPNSKETAIVMICDSAEAISRLSGKTREEIELIISSTIQSKFLDGQFDECNITLKELHTIKETCVKYIYGTQHHRVEYKDIPDSQNRS